MRWLLATAVVLVVIALGGCGGEDDPPVEREPQASGPTRGEIESFARIKLPVSVTNLKAKQESGMDTAMFVSFAMDSRDLQGFIDGAKFSGPPQEGDRAVADNESLGWNITGIERLVGHGEVEDGLGRNIVIDLDRPDRPVVYLEATTL